jgi:hypothetical protein
MPIARINSAEKRAPLTNPPYHCTPPAFAWLLFLYVTCRSGEKSS